MRVKIGICVTLIGLATGFLFNCYANRRWRQSHVLNIIIPVIIFWLLHQKFGLSLDSLKGFIFSLLLLYAANSDLYTREVTNWVPFSIILIGLIGVELSVIIQKLFAAILITLPQLIIAVRYPNRYGGGDIKVSAACAFVLGIERGIIGLITGLFLAIVCTFCNQKVENRKIEAIPLIPYLATGFILAYII